MGNEIAKMCWSDDGGKTWSSEHPIDARIVRKRDTDIIIKFRVSDPVKVVMLGAWADVSLGAH